MLVIAKGATLVLLHRVAGTASLWAPIAYIWQDVLVALVFFLASLALDGWLRRPALVWILYGGIAAYAALNVPIAGVLSSPLTVPLIRAAGGALSDSIAHYVTPANLIALALPLVVAVLLPVWLSRRRLVIGWPWLVVGLAIVAAGPWATARTETRGLHRNALGALVETSLPRLTPVPLTADWRASPVDAAPGGDDRSPLRGTLAGRNVVLIVLESTAARYLGAYGAPRDPMPVLSSLARDGIVFDRAYAVYPESIKGLFATLCSTYPAFDTEPEIYAGVPCASLAAQLRGGGYRTALVHSGRFDYLGMRSVIEQRGFDVLEDAGAISGNVHSSFGVDERATVVRLLQWIDATAGDRGSSGRPSPFFITYLPIAGHHPYAATRPGPFDGSDDFSRYLNVLHEGDEALGVFIRGLQARGLDRETLFVIFGDHGEAFGQHPGNFAHTLFIYEENVRVPLVIVAPGARGGLEGGRRVPRLASVIDVAPTVLDLLGLAVPETYQGSSLLASRSRMALFFTDYSLGWLGLADGCWKYLFEMEADRSRLFDVCTDPDETRDVAAHAPDRVAAYRARVTAWAAAQKASLMPRAPRAVP